MDRIVEDDSAKSLFRIRIFGSSGSRVCERSVWCQDLEEAKAKAHFIAHSELKITPATIVVLPEPVRKD